MLLGAAPAAHAALEVFSDPVGDNSGLSSDGQTIVAPDMTYASQQQLADGRIELATSFGPGTCKLGSTDFPARAHITLYTTTQIANAPDLEIVFDTERQSYVMRGGAPPHRVVSKIDGADAGGILTVTFNPQYVGKPPTLRWMSSQFCRGDLPNEDVELMPNDGFFALKLPYTAPTVNTYDPPSAGSPDPLPDALPATTAVGTKQLAAAATSAATRLRAGLPTRGMLLSFSGLPDGTLTAILGKSIVLARGQADTKAGKASVRLKPTAAGRKALRGSGSLRTQLKLIFTPDAGGKQATVIKSVTLKRRR